MNQKELTKSFMMISILKKNALVSMVYTKVFQRFKVNAMWLLLIREVIREVFRLRYER